MKPPKEKKTSPQSRPLEAWFLGPKGEHSEIWSELFSYIFEDYVYWRRNYFPQDPIVIDRMRRRKHQPWFDYMTSNLDNILNDLKAHFPFYSPRYIAHMLSEQTLPSILGYFAGMLYNPNNVTDEAAPVTVRLELEVGKMVSKMIGYNPDDSWAHIASGGTIANIEALWVARIIQFIPLILQDYCIKENIRFEIENASGDKAQISDFSKSELIHMRPDKAIGLTKKLARFLVLEQGNDQEQTLDRISNHIHTSSYNPNIQGLFSVLQNINLKPSVYVSSTAHYSVKKSVNVLGYGEASVVPVPVNEKFRMNVDALHELLFDQQDDHYCVATVAVIGTTEEGAVDGIHKIDALRTRFEKEKGRSFWLHADAAWGGYFRSLFCGNNFDPDNPDILEKYKEFIDARETYKLSLSTGKSKEYSISWDDEDVYNAFLSMNKADSVTIDPHKMGYVPYPAGIVAFKNGMVTDFLAHKAQYISEIEEGIKDISDHPTIHAIGPYILEGSKPGAAAAACWLSHKSIPLEAEGHGKIIKTSVLSAQRLTNNLQNHRFYYNIVEKQIAQWDKQSKANHPFTFFPLYEPDTNIVCFIAMPMIQEKDKWNLLNKDLQWINAFNENIYEHLTIAGVDLGYKPPYAQPYFVSRTTFTNDQYDYNSINKILEHFNITKEEYDKYGLFVLRSTVMNPLYPVADQAGKDYLLDFVKYLHLVTRDVINKMF